MKDPFFAFLEENHAAVAAWPEWKRRAFTTTASSGGHVGLKAAEKAARERLVRSRDVVKLADAWGLGLPEVLKHLLVAAAWRDVNEAEAALNKILDRQAQDEVDAHTRLLDAVDTTKDPS